MQAVYELGAPAEVQESSRLPALEDPDAPVPVATPPAEASEFALARRSALALLGACVCSSCRWPCTPRGAHCTCGPRALTSASDRLATTPVTKDALKDSGIGKLVHKMFKDHPDAEVKRRCKAIKEGWVALLETGGADPAVVDPGFFVQVRVSVCRAG